MVDGGWWTADGRWPSCKTIPNPNPDPNIAGIVRETASEHTSWRPDTP